MHSAREPETITGAREPKAVRAQTAASLAAQRGTGKVRAVPEGKKGYRFVSARYRLQLTAPRATSLSDGRIIDPDKAKVVIADQYVAFLDRDKQAETIALLEAHPSFNIDFFDIEKQVEAARVASLAQAVETLTDSETLKDPAARAALRAALEQAEQEDFENPSAPGQ